MASRLLNLLTALSLLVGVAAVAVWVRSYGTVDVVRAVFSHGGYRAATMLDFDPTPGRVVLEFSSGLGEGPAGFSHHSAAIGDDVPSLNIYSTMDTSGADLPGGFGYRRGDRAGSLFNPPARLRVVMVPLWPVILVAGVAPTLRLRAWRTRNRRAAIGLCPRCGYDLRATPEKCPECGTTVTTPA